MSDLKKGRDVLADEVTSQPGVSDVGIEVRRADKRNPGVVSHGYARVTDPESHKQRAVRHLKHLVDTIKTQPKPNLTRSEITEADLRKDDFYSKKIGQLRQEKHAAKQKALEAHFGAKGQAVPEHLKNPQPTNLNYKQMKQEFQAKNKPGAASNSAAAPAKPAAAPAAASSPRYGKLFDPDRSGVMNYKQPKKLTASEDKKSAGEVLKRMSRGLKKVDPKTRLPGVLVNKSEEVQKNININPPLSMSEGMKKMCAYLKKCGMSKTLTASEKPAKLDIGKKPHKKDPILNSKPAAPKPPSAEYTKKVQAYMKEKVSKAELEKFDQELAKSWGKAQVDKAEGAPAPAPSPAKPAMPKMQAPKIKQPKPQMPKQKMPEMQMSEMKKDDVAHPAGSPEERSHAVAEGQASLPEAIHSLPGSDAKKRFFDHLKTLKDKSKHRSPENVMKSEESSKRLVKALKSLKK